MEVRRLGACLAPLPVAMFVRSIVSLGQWWIYYGVVLPPEDAAPDVNKEEGGVHLVINRWARLHGGSTEIS
uniref:Uncharacterized protein n=1 Tax=Oryza sativa subsp. japonica TaxID=39947 RepID=Q6K492_ORYSJ|nr:hypothetical protein [Oryza sativa Japonica Group]BAD22277.1 hypothetical protein [Oryza sativa Japonica Group]